jgi:hypothetical protein
MIWPHSLNLTNSYVSHVRFHPDRVVRSAAPAKATRGPALAVPLADGGTPNTTSLQRACNLIKSPLQFCLKQIVVSNHCLFGVIPQKQSQTVVLRNKLRKSLLFSIIYFNLCL